MSKLDTEINKTIPNTNSVDSDKKYLLNMVMDSLEFHFLGDHK